MKIVVGLTHGCKIARNLKHKSCLIKGAVARWICWFVGDQAVFQEISQKWKLSRIYRGISFYVPNESFSSSSELEKRSWN